MPSITKFNPSDETCKFSIANKISPTISLFVKSAFGVVSVGVAPNPLVPTSVEGLELGRKNTIAVNENMQSSIPFIYAGGDIVRGGATVILAMGDGRRAAAAMHEQLSK